MNSSPLSPPAPPASATVAVARLIPHHAEDQAHVLLCLKDAEPRSWGWIAIRSVNALTGCVVFKAVERTDEPVAGDASTHVRR